MATIDLDHDPVWIEICEKFAIPLGVSWADIIEEEDERQKIKSSPPVHSKPKPKPVQNKAKPVSVSKGNPFGLLAVDDWKKVPALHVTGRKVAKNAKPSIKHQ